MLGSGLLIAIQINEFCCVNVYSITSYSGTPLIRSPTGKKILAVLTGDCINEGFFTKKCMAVLLGGQNKEAVRRGFTVLP